MNDRHPNDMAHRIVPAPPTRITVSGGPKVEAHLSQPDADPITRHTHTAAELLLVLSALTILVVTLIVVIISQQRAGA